MSNKSLVQGVGAISTTWGLLLWFTSSENYHQVVGSTLLTLGVPASITASDPSVHQVTSTIFLVWAALFTCSVTSESICGALAALFFLLGVILHVDRSSSMRGAVGTVLVLWGILLSNDPVHRFDWDDSQDPMVDIGSFSRSLGAMLWSASCQSDYRSLCVFYCVHTVLWFTSGNTTSLWSVAIWFFFLHESFPRIWRVCLYAAALPLQALLLLAVAIGERTSSQLDDRGDQISPFDKDEPDQQPSRLARIAGVLRSIIFRICTFWFPDSHSLQTQRKYEERQFFLLRCILIVPLLLNEPIDTLKYIIWDPVFKYAVPSSYLWWNSFTYEALNSTQQTIRLLNVEPGANTDALRCTLVEESVRGARYEALSYTWGGHLTLRRAIKINNRIFWVTDSVASVLRNLRLPDKQRSLWIDQICVNQWDNDEKSDQVRNKMSLIFAKAQRVIIWLGKPLPFLSTAFEDLRLVLEYQSKQGPLGEIDKTPVWAAMAKHKSTWENLLSRPWWSRTWVIQEAILGHNPVIRCGEAELAWELLNDFADVKAETCNPTQITRELLSFSRDFKSGKTNNLNIVDITLRFRQSGVSRPVDRIYAFFGFFEGDTPTDMQVDYTREVHSVFADYTAYHIKKTQSLRTLAIAESHGFLMSWVVNFAFDANWMSTESFLHQLEHDRLKPDAAISSASRAYCASGTRLASNIRHLPGELEIGLRGWHADTVKDVCCLARETSFSSCIAAWEEFARSHSADWITERPGFIRILLGDNRLDDLHSNWYDQYVDMDDNRSDSTKSRASRNYDRHSNHYLPLFFNICTNRRLFVTRRGHLGIGPRLTKGGDYICVLEGCRVPVVLRNGKKDRRPSTDMRIPMDLDKSYMFIGETVLQAHMFASDERLLEDEQAGLIQVGEIKLS